MEDHCRTLREIGEEYEKLWEKVWWNRHMSDGEPKEGREAAERIVATWGEEFLDPGDDIEWGICLGKMMALVWVLGSDWTEAGDT